MSEVVIDDRIAIVDGPECFKLCFADGTPIPDGAEWIDGSSMVTRPPLGAVLIDLATGNRTPARPTEDARYPGVTWD